MSFQIGQIKDIMIKGTSPFSHRGKICEVPLHPM